MAELDPELVGRKGVDPVTGSVLSQEVRSALIRKSTIDSAIFQKQITAIGEEKREIDKQNITVIRGQENALSAFSASINDLRSDIGKLSTGLTNIAFLLQKDSIEDQNRLKQEQENERRLTEQQVRVGKESAIEQKIQNAVAAPVEKLVPKVQNIFSGIGQALGILFLGWLTNQVVDGVKASGEENTKKLNDIKLNIVKNVGIAVGGLFAIRAGFSLIRKTISGIALGLGNLLIAKPLKAAASFLTGGLLGKGKGGGGSRPGRGGGGMGRFVTFLSGLMNAKNQEWTDFTLSMLAVAARGPGIIGAIGKIAGIAFTADEIAEAFGMNIFGDPKRDAQINEIAQAAKNKLLGTQTAPAAAKPAPEAPPTSAPQQTMMGANVAQPPPAAPVAPQISSEMESKFEMAWKYRKNPLARGRIQSAWESLSPEDQQSAIQWAKAKGYNWEEMKLTPKSPVAQSQPSEPSMQPPMAEGSQAGKPIEPGPTVAQINIPPKPPQEVGNLPEPKPTVTMISSSNQQNQEQPPITYGPMTNIPFIRSSNPDNFYVLYSQFNYNVVT